jgi:hypothetical protein
LGDIGTIIRDIEILHYYQAPLYKKNF